MQCERCGAPEATVSVFEHRGRATSHRAVCGACADAEWARLQASAPGPEETEYSGWDVVPWDQQAADLPELERRLAADVLASWAHYYAFLASHMPEPPPAAIQAFVSRHLRAAV